MEITKLAKYASKCTQRHALVVAVTDDEVTYLIWCPADRWQAEGQYVGEFRCTPQTFRAVWEDWA